MQLQYMESKSVNYDDTSSVSSEENTFSYDDDSIIGINKSFNNINCESS